MNKDRNIVCSIDQRNRNTCLFQPRHARQQRSLEFLGHRTFLPRIALPGKMAVQDNLHIDAAPVGEDEGVDHTIVVLASQLADQEQHQFYRMPRAVDLGNDGMMRPIVLAVHRRLAPERVQQVEMA